MQQDKEVEHREQERLLANQPGKVDSMNYAPQWQQQQPYFEHK
jgi:hypothetical protein